VFPNPFLDKFTIAYDSEEEGIVNIQVIAPYGQRVLNEEIEIGKGMQYIPIKLGRRYPPGGYYVVITDNYKSAIYHKIVKQ
jgi:hypothetical protein